MQVCKKVEAQEMAVIDDGWAIPNDSTESLIALMHDTDAFPTAAEEAALDASDLDQGWNLAEGTGEHTPPVFPHPGVVSMAFCPAPLQSANTLGPEQQAEFSKPDLALGTDIDLPPPSGAWFAELTGLVPRSAPQAAPKKQSVDSPTELNLKSCFSESEDAFFASGDEIEVTHQLQHEEFAQGQASPVKRRWWQRRKRA